MSGDLFAAAVVKIVYLHHTVVYPFGPFVLVGIISDLMAFLEVGIINKCHNILYAFLVC